MLHRTRQRLLRDDPYGYYWRLSIAIVRMLEWETQ